ncbi:hypothetical protein C2G38_2242563 [Gigaspora rosea]|uniref:AMP-dependent synthetase/ligase domain-containing protein n=1 Tax=Gigaspora rosea TaxID=44941 RepID=A0A397VM83_9GLOM|nr:hypothetical protein C2G38_2242563 [Gigaspora rosea]
MKIFKSDYPDIEYGTSGKVFPSNPLCKVEKIASQLTDSGASIIFAHQECYDVVPVSYTPEEARATTVLLCYSYGTVGNQKGVEITHTYIVASVAQIIAMDDFGNDAIFMGMLGGTIAIVPKSNVREICRCIQNYKISYAHFIPQTIHKLAEDPIVKNYDISSLRIKAESRMKNFI